jgi:DNA-binding transcriptional ArsR family regulator
VNDRSPSGGEARLDAVLGALADPTRRSLFERLRTDGPSTATDLAEGMPVTRQAVVKHLQVMTGAGLLASRRDGREVQYRAQPDAMEPAMAWMASAGAAWDRRFERLRRSFSPADESEA